MQQAVPAPVPAIILASTSPYRKALLERLRLPFETAKPGVDETRHRNEDASAMVLRLAREKALAIAIQRPEAWIIGSDQCAVLGDAVLGKPGAHEQAANQLRESSGRSVTFRTGLCLVNLAQGFERCVEEPFTVHFRDLSEHEIQHYLGREQPYDCAGSFKSEGLGVTLFRAMEGRDPSALIGLPLMALCDLLREAGVDPLGIT
ncbi:MAG: Maf family protein [Pseudomonadota bacterium]